VGEVYDGAVTRVVEYGCFVKIEATGAEGLVHLTELTEVGGYRPDQLVSPGERVRVKVLAVDRSKRRVSLSARQAAY
jgi:ribosomal protein S1